MKTCNVCGTEFPEEAPTCPSCKSDDYRYSKMRISPPSSVYPTAKQPENISVSEIIITEGTPEKSKSNITGIIKKYTEKLKIRTPLSTVPAVLATVPPKVNNNNLSLEPVLQALARIEATQQFILSELKNKQANPIVSGTDNGVPVILDEHWEFLNFEMKKSHLFSIGIILLLGLILYAILFL